MSLKMKKKKKILKIRYNKPEEFNKFEIDSTDIGNLSQIPIPGVEHHRSEYFHAINVFIENNPLSNELMEKREPIFSSSQLSKICDIYKKLLDYTMISREFLSKNHKMLLWTIRCRLNLIIHYHSAVQVDYGEYSTLIYLKEKYELIISKKNVYSYSLGELWRALLILISKINCIYYHGSLKYYIDCLFLCCGKFFFISNNDIHLFDNLLYCDKNNGICSINKPFIEETERIFYGIQKRIYAYSMFSLSSMEITSLPLNSIKLNIFYEWLLNFADSAFLEFIEKDLKNQIYEWHLYIGEKERYMKEEKFGDPTGYNIIAKLRSEFIDKCIDELKQSNVVKKMLKRIQSSSIEEDVVEEEEQSKIDIDLQGLCIIIIDYIMDSILPPEKRFSERFIFKRDQLVTPLYYHQINSDFPLIVQSFNEFGIYYKNKLYQYETFPICFIYWVKFACEDTKINGGFPQEDKSINLIFLYEKFFPEKNTTLQNIKQNLGISEANFFPVLPFHYVTDYKDVF